MIKHLIKLVWNRKRINFLITLEILISFLVLFAVLLLGFYYADNYRQPLGFNYQNIYSVYVDMKQVGDNDFTPEQKTMMQQVMQSIKSLDGVEDVAGSMSTPYSNNSYRSITDVKGGVIAFELNEATDSFNNVMSIHIVRGRWFGKEDNADNLRPVVLNQRMSRILYGDEDPIGKIFDENKRVVGIIDDFRKDGEFSAPENFAFFRKNLENEKDRPPQQLVIKVRAGTSAAFEEKLTNQMQNVAKDWSFEIEPLAEMRDTSLKQSLIPVAVIGIIAGFLLLMVALGLTGVLWQNVTQRTREIGLRRAKGATAVNIYKQIIGELLIIASSGLLVGMVIIMQFPLLNLIGYISNRVYFVSMFISLAMIYLLTIACSLYPSRLATKVHPAAALHYE